MKTEVACLCNATDGKLMSGHFPGVDKYPLVLGHEGAGIVQAVGPKVRNFKVGERVIGGLLFEFSDRRLASGWGGFCEYTLANDHDAMLADGVADAAHGWVECYEIQRRVDADIPAEEAALLCTWREVYGGFGDFDLKAGDHILVFGAGPVGLSSSSSASCSAWAGSASSTRCRTNASVRWRWAPTPFSGRKTCRASEQEMGRTFDAVIDAVGNETIINAGLPLVKMGGSICVYGVIAASSLPVHKALGPYNFNLLVHQWPTRRREREAQRRSASGFARGGSRRRNS